jgi:hypothetical protein
MASFDTKYENKNPRQSRLFLFFGFKFKVVEHSSASSSSKAKCWEIVVCYFADGFC